MKSSAEKSRDFHRSMLEKGFKKQSFYFADATLKAIVKYKEQHGLSNMNDAINQMISEVK